MRREICGGKNENGKSLKCKEYIFKLYFQDEGSNKQLLISSRLQENISEHRYGNTHSHNLSCVCVQETGI